jgi:hypothetical protein
VGSQLGYATGQSRLILRAGYIASLSSNASDGSSSSGPSLGFGLARERVQLDVARNIETFSTGLVAPPTHISIRVGL